MPARSGLTLPLYRSLSRLLTFARGAPRAPLETGPFVRALRVKYRMSQRQLGNRCGLPQQHIARIESGAVDPSVGTLRRIVAAMGCELHLAPKQLVWPGDLLAARIDRLQEIAFVKAEWMRTMTSRLWDQ